jgi:hypothetical protein
MANADAKRRFTFGAGLAQNGKSGQGLSVDLGDKVRFVGAFLLPHLADLDLFDGHLGSKTTLDRTAEGVNRAKQHR